MTGFDLDGYVVRRLSAGDAAELQDLHERCSDYHELHDGTPTRPTAAADELAALPPGKELADKFAIGVYTADGRLVGHLDAVRDCPAQGEWWIGLLMVDPSLRSGGLGSRIYQAATRWIASQGGHAVFLGVLEKNPAAERFWRRQGFEELRRQPYTTETGMQHTIIVMRHALPAHA